MKRLTKTYSDGTHGASDNLPCGENSYDYKSLLLEKLGKYEDLEERLNKVYGDCDGLLESMIELLEKHSGVDIPNDTVKVLLLTNKSVDFYKECEDLDVQDRLIKLPCKVGDTVWDNDYDRPCAYTITAFSFGECEEYICEPVTTKEVVFYYTNSSGSITGSFAESEIGKSVFLSKAEAEAKLKELRCSNE